MAGDQRRFQTAMLHGDRFYKQSKWLDAMKAYRFALAEFPNNSAAIIGFGKAALASDQLDLSGKAFRQALKINPTNLEALQLIGDVQERTGQLDAAAETYLRMGNVYASRNDLDTAIDFWLRATSLVSGHTGAHRKLADALAQQGKNRLAAREFLILASIYQRQNETDQVQRCISLAQELLPKDPGVLAAITAVERGERIKPTEIKDAPPEPEVPDEFFPDFAEEDPFGLDELFASAEDQPQRLVGGLVELVRKQALEQLANLIFEDSDNPNVMLIMQAVDAESRDERIDAIDLYRQATENGEKLPALYFNLGLLYREQGQLSEAAECLEQAVDDEHFMPSAHFALGETYYATNDTERAVRHFVDALAAVDMQTVSGHRFYELAQKYESYADQFLGQSNPEQIRQFVFSLQSFFASFDWEKKVYEARMRMNSLSEDEDTMSLAEYLETPETEVTVTTLANTSEYMRQNLYMCASEECLRAIQKVPSFLPLHARLAEVLLKQDRTEDAITKYLYIARVYQMRSQVDQAINTLQRILKLAPMDVTVRANLIDLYVASNGIERALDEYLVLADSYYQLAQVDRSLEKYQETIRLADQVDESQSWKEQALLRMADIYNQRFDWSRSAAAVEQLRKLKPHDESLMRQLIELYFKQGKASEGLPLLDQLLEMYQRQSPAASLELLQELVTSFPNHLQLRQRLAVAYVQNNMTHEAIAEYDTLGEMQLEQGFREQAIQTVQAIINLGPEDVEGYRRLLAQISGGAY